MEINFLNYSSEKHPLNGSFSALSELPLELLSSKGFFGELLFYINYSGPVLGFLKIFYSLDGGLTKSEAFFSENENCYQIKNSKNGRVAIFKPFFNCYSFDGNYNNISRFVKESAPKKYIFNSFNQESMIISGGESAPAFFVIGFDTYIEPCFFSNNESENFSLSVEVSSFEKY